jgi:hypothetical protein
MKPQRHNLTASSQTDPVCLTRNGTNVVSLLCAPAPLRKSKSLLKEGWFHAEARRTVAFWRVPPSAHFQADTSGGSWDWLISREDAKTRRTREERGGVTFPVDT